MDEHAAGWVNNAALFRDVALHTASAAEVMELMGANLGPDRTPDGRTAPARPAAPRGALIRNSGKRERGVTAASFVRCLFR